MPGYDTPVRCIDPGGPAYRIRSPLDIARFADPDGSARGADIRRLAGVARVANA